MDQTNAKAVYIEPFEDPIKSAWENVVLNGLPPTVPVRPEILRSWERCKEIGLDPYSENSPPVLTGNKLKRLFDRNKELIEISKPVMDMIEISVRDTGFIVTLTDKDGYVLVVRGDEEILEMAEQNHYLPGCLRSVEHAGTNAIGVSLVEGKPIQITGAEHYKVRHHPWTCSSSPIYDCQNKIIGAITLSGRSIGRHKHTLALVTSAAETIESQLRERNLIEEKQRLNSMLTLIFNAISDGLIAVDNRMKITRINRAAASMLGLDSEAAIGNSLEKVVRPDSNLLHSIKKKKYFTGREITFHCTSTKRSYISSIQPVHNNSGRLLGTIITMAGKQHVINIAKKIGGNCAKYEFTDIKGENPKLLKQIELAKVAARTNSRILIIGESGTGKELFAQAIHNYSNRRNGPFVAISCAAIPRDLIESELFGYRGGAFTGARREGQVGKFELAHKGTLFLDEVDGLPLDLQAKLLRVLQQNEIVRLGDTQPISVDVRVIAASNADLLAEVENANFREDFYYRLNVVEIGIPPLRDRIEDLELLIDHFMNRHCQEMNIRRPKISKEVLTIFKNYSWPGNVRELENCLERAILLSQGKIIRKIHIPERLWKKPKDAWAKPRSLREGYAEILKATLSRCEGNISRTARELGISRSTLYRKIKEFGLTPNGFIQR
ncbi:MAG: sigma-54-dependent Fis family transcriptional regulator [Deltaproteobacteria bacterium]|nr:MAG: sigma-54-dependent Fis family transcriptional regulator [Deltaproteobacteria bacterium]